MKKRVLAVVPQLPSGPGSVWPRWHLLEPPPRVTWASLLSRDGSGGPLALELLVGSVRPQWGCVAPSTPPWAQPFLFPPTDRVLPGKRPAQRSPAHRRLLREPPESEAHESLNTVTDRWVLPSLLPPLSFKRTVEPSLGRPVHPR